MEKDDQEIQARIIQRGNLPRHIAVIMDGNGRWARQRGQERIAGHRAAVESVRDIVRAAGELGVKVLTLYAFSSENWNRPRREVFALMRLLKETLERETKELKGNNVRLMAIGRTDQLPKATLDALMKAIEATAEGSGLILNLALNYGGRSEIVDAVRQVASDVEKGKRRVKDIDEVLLSQYLYTSGLPEPDLLIRTSGEMRLSNFLLWQMAYTEIWVTDVLWPDFRREHLYQAIEGYQSRERRFGRIRE